MRGWLSVKDAAERMGMHVESFRRAVRKDTILIRVRKEKVATDKARYVQHLYNEEDVNMRAEQKTLRAQRRSSTT